MKKIISIFIALLLFALPSAVFASADDVSSNVSGFSNVEFSDGYRGFCIDAELKGAETGDTFTPAEGTGVATNNKTGADVSQMLKILLTQCFEDIFVSDGNGGYVVDSYKASSSVQGAIWNITDDRYTYGEGKEFVERVKAYDGPEIPDEGYTLTLSTGETVVFSFKVVEPARDDQQSFFCYKVVTTDEKPHEHEYSDKWTSDDENHWHECDCNDKADLDKHTASEADCVNPSICIVCNKELSGVNSEKHTGNTVVKDAKSATEFENGYTGDIYCKDCDTLIEKGEVIPATHKHEYSDKWTSDDENHWHECDCNDKADLDKHTASEADCVNPSICTVCSKELSGVNSEKHTGNTVTKDAKPATEFENGYTGDIYCKDCDTLIEKGEVIPATHKHEYSDKWTSDDENHWHECDCNDKADLDKHTASEADCVNPSICTVCSKELSGVDSEKHTGNTVTKDAKSATEFENGYTGDIYCKDCDTLIEEGEIIPATHKHEYSDKWTSDDENHWHECDCGDKADTAAHSFKDGVCTVCGKETAADDEAPSIDLDSILGALPEIDFDSILDGIIGIIGGITSGGNDNGSNGSNSGNNVDTEIPDTGSDATVAFAYAIAAISLISLAYMGRKKLSRSK